MLRLPQQNANMIHFPMELDVQAVAKINQNLLTQRMDVLAFPTSSSYCLSPVLEPSDKVRSHCILARQSDLAGRICASSCKLYRPPSTQALRTLASIHLVSASASCAWDGTQRIMIPLFKCSLTSFACSCVRNS